MELQQHTDSQWAHYTSSSVKRQLENPHGAKRYQQMCSVQNRIVLISWSSYYSGSEEDASEGMIKDSMFRGKYHGTYKHSRPQQRSGGLSGKLFP